MSGRVIPINERLKIAIDEEKDGEAIYQKKMTMYVKTPMDVMLIHAGKSYMSIIHAKPIWGSDVAKVVRRLNYGDVKREGEIIYTDTKFIIFHEEDVIPLEEVIKAMKMKPKEAYYHLDRVKTSM